MLGHRCKRSDDNLLLLLLTGTRWRLTASRKLCGNATWRGEDMQHKLVTTSCYLHGTVSLFVEGEIVKATVEHMGFMLGHLGWEHQ